MARGSIGWMALALWALQAACGPPSAGPQPVPGEPLQKTAPPEASERVPVVPTPARLESLRVIYSSVGGQTGNLWVAKAAGIFEKYGFDVELLLIPSSSRVIQSLVAGDAPLAQAGGPALISARLQGADVMTIARTLNTLHLFLLADPSVTRVEDLRGKVLGISQAGTSSDYAGRYVLKAAGLEPDRDVALQRLGDDPTRLAALQAGGVAATFLVSPFNRKAVEAGFKQIMDLGQQGVEYPGMGLVTTESFLRDNQELVGRFMKAYVEGIWRYKTDRSFSKRVLSEYMQIDDEEVLEDAYETYAVKYLPRAPLPTAGSVRAMLQDMATTDPRAAAARAEDFMNDHFVKELESTGFINRLYQ